jgi:hypothetical protein
VTEKRREYSQPPVTAKARGCPQPDRDTRPHSHSKVLYLWSALGDGAKRPRHFRSQDETGNPQVATPLTVDPSQLRLQVQAPDLRVFGHLVPMQGQAVDNGIEHRLGHQWPMKRPCALIAEGCSPAMPAANSRSTCRCHRPAGEYAFDAGHQAQALAVRLRLRMAASPPKPCPAQPSGCFILNLIPSLSSSIEEQYRKMENRR